MGKKRIVKTGENAEGEKKVSTATVSKKKVEVGMLFVESTYNNTKIVLTDAKGNVLATSSSGSIGFKGAKKGTPFAAAKVGEARTQVSGDVFDQHGQAVGFGVQQQKELSVIHLQHCSFSHAFVGAV